MANHPILPTRPLPLRTSFIVRSYLLGGLASFGGAAVAIAGIVWQLQESRTILHEQQVWDHGVPAQTYSVEGRKSTNHAVFDEYRLTVKYTDADGKEHQLKSEFDSAFRSVDEQSDPMIHYDPKHPDDFALAWAIQLGWGRWANVLIMLLTCGGIGLLFVFIGLRLFSRLSDARACAEWSDELELEVVRITKITKYGRDTGARRFQYRMPVAEGGKLFEDPFTTKHLPLFSDSTERFIIGLRSSRSGRPTLVRHDFYPFVLTDEQKQAVLKRLEQRNQALKTA
jgi:hypothetical protein